MPGWVLGLKRPFQFGMVVAFLTAIITLFQPNYYRSVARLLPVESKALPGALGGLASAAAAFGIGSAGGDGIDANFPDILGSRLILEQILKTGFEYHIRSNRFGAERLVRGTVFDYFEAKNMDQAVGKLGAALSVSRDIKSKVVSISTETKSPELSQQITQRAEAAGGLPPGKGPHPGQCQGRLRRGTPD